MKIFQEIDSGKAGAAFSASRLSLDGMKSLRTWRIPDHFHVVWGKLRASKYWLLVVEVPNCPKLLNLEPYGVRVCLGPSRLRYSAWCAKLKLSIA